VELVIVGVVEGGVVVEMPDHRGELWRYALREVAPERWQTSRFLAQKLGGLGEEYAVSTYVDRQGVERWVCTCPAWRFRARRGAESCKHAEVGKGYRQLLESLRTQRVEVGCGAV
jgi:hypothetical protein